MTKDFVSQKGVEFFFLHNVTGALLSGPHSMSHDELHNQEIAYINQPSTALFVDLTRDSANNCGFLFLNKDYVDKLTPIPPAGTTQNSPIQLDTDGPGDGKYPKGASAADRLGIASTLDKLLTMASRQNDTLLSPSELNAIRSLLRVMS